MAEISQWYTDKGILFLLAGEGSFFSNIVIIVIMKYSNYMHEKWIDAMSPELFWDVDQLSINVSKHLAWLTERVMTYGSSSDWGIFISHVSRDQLKSVRSHLRLQQRERIFIENYIDGVI